MERKIILTEDGSHSILIPGLNVTYHSMHGSIRESMHVFIESGMVFYLKGHSNQTIRIFEMGLGTGLNALLTYIGSEKRGLKVYYNAVELFPLSEDEIQMLNYCEQIGSGDLKHIFKFIHSCAWEKSINLSPFFTLHKTKINLINFKPEKPHQSFDLIFFDAFDPKVQPELWSTEIFGKMFSILKENGILVTYSSKGDVRRAMRSAGFSVEKIPGPKGKREIVRARK
ncbi:MAG: hypothetical protein B6D37_14600 [Sphingobacteriales bacterium UTBCD1]|jgi:tRNA U34 5-methylaminomethyl-2-thiouridine-forming methyltransferase MnmC|nr:MAG: hypothetical protein B6D37_14600 [Sphingobacteriales bacterium UTBCD1]